MAQIAGRLNIDIDEARVRCCGCGQHQWVEIRPLGFALVLGDLVWTRVSVLPSACDRCETTWDQDALTEAVDDWVR